MAAKRIAGMELGVPPVPTGLCADLIYIYKTTSYFLFGKRRAPATNAACRAACSSFGGYGEKLAPWSGLLRAAGHSRLSIGHLTGT
jgi:hypothetical protein